MEVKEEVPIKIASDTIISILSSCGNVYKWGCILLGSFAAIIFTLTILQQGNCKSMCAELADFHTQRCETSIHEKGEVYTKVINIGNILYDVN